MLVTKATAAIAPGADDSDSENGSFDIILSSQTRDRDGDVFKADEWKTPLPEWIPIDVDHAMSVEKTVGSGTPFINADGDLQVRGTYASTPLAQQTRTLVKEGHVRYVSVAVMTDKSLKDGAPNRELLNGAFVNTPSNREAIVLASKGLEVGEEIEVKADDKKPYGNVAYADPGYLDSEGKPAKDGKGQPRYPVDTAAHARAAWSYINMPKNSGQYSAEQLDKIKDKIKAACDKFGIKVDDSKSFHDTIAAVDRFLNGDVATVTLESSGSTSTLSAPIIEKAGARNSAGDSKMIQAIHDASSILGAQCVSEPEPDADDGSDDGANKSYDVGGDLAPAVQAVNDTDAAMSIYSPKDLETFKCALDVLTKTSGTASPEPSEPADPPAAPSGPAAGDAADEDEEAPEILARNLRMRMLAFDADRASVS